MIARIRRFFAPDYTDGNWHIWRAGMRPVPADAVVSAVVLIEGDEPSIIHAVQARVLDWGHQNDPVIAFRYLGRMRPTDGDDMTASARNLTGPEE